MSRVGIGYDLHRLVDGRPLVLGGVIIPFDKGLAGHSDADALCHAITDAVLGAAALGNIGQHFPDTDPQWRGADSVALLAQANTLLQDAGYVIVNVDANIVAERPKMAPYLTTMRERLAACLGIEHERISVKAKTNEGLGPEGRGEAISAHAVVLVKRREP